MADLKQAPSLRIMSEGWNHPAWVGALFPDDLPHDWRLAYYANEFRGVLVPQRDWLGVDGSVCEAWTDDVDAGFRFFLELNLSESIADCRQTCQCLAGSLGGVVVSSGIDAMDLQGIPLFQRRRLGESGSAVLPRAWFLEGVEAKDLRLQRRLLESIVAESPSEAQIPLFVQGKPPSIELMRNLQQLAQLMGFS